MALSTQRNVKFSSIILRNESREDFEATITTTRFFGFFTNKTIPILLDEHDQKRFQYNENGTSFRLTLKRKSDGNMIIRNKVINTCQRLTIDVAGDIMEESVEMPVANLSDRQRRDIFIETMKQNDFYKILGVDRNATNEDLRRSYLSLIHQHHPDKNHGSLKSVFITQKLIEAHKFLKNNNRDMYNKFLDNRGGFFSYSRWRAFFADRDRWPYLCLTITFAFLGVGATLASVALAPSAIMLYTGYVTGSALISSGVAGARKVLSQDAALHGVKPREIRNIMIVNATSGAVVGIISAYSGLTLPDIISEILLKSVPNWASSAISGAATGAITGGAGGAGNVASQALVEDRWKYMNAGARARDLVFGAMMGAGVGAAMGAGIGAYVGAEDIGGGVGLVNTGADEAAGFAAGMGQDLSRAVFKEAGKAIMSKIGQSPPGLRISVLGGAPAILDRNDDNAFPNGTNLTSSEALYVDEEEDANNVQNIHNDF